MKKSWSLALVLMCGAATARAQVFEYAHVDALGSVRAMTDGTGRVLERHDYLPFGEEWQPAPPRPEDQPLRFTGKERDGETGLDYFGARYYGNRIARFTTVDPKLNTTRSLGDPQRWNRYAYGRNNPLSYVDPDGRDIFLANQTGSGRQKALHTITANLTVSEQKNVHYARMSDGRYKLQLRDNNAITPAAASPAYRYLQNRINDHSLGISYTLVKVGLETGQTTIHTDRSGAATGRIDVVVPEDGGRGVMARTPSGREVAVDQPAHILAAHELLGETEGVVPGAIYGPAGRDAWGPVAIGIENEIRQWHGLPERTGSDHAGFLSETITVRP